MWRDHVGWSGTLTVSLMVVVVIVALAAVGALTWLVIEMARREARSHPQVTRRAELLLAGRYARGEIDANQYWHLLGDLRRHRR